MPNNSLVPPDRVEFGFDSNGVAKNRLIIKEKTDKSKVKVYDKETDIKYLCVGCMRTRNTRNYAHLINSEVHEPGFHLCKPISAADCATEQAAFKKKFAEHDALAFDNVKSSSMPRKSLELTSKLLHPSPMPMKNVEVNFDEQENDCLIGDAMKPSKKKYAEKSKNVTTVEAVHKSLPNNLDNVGNAPKVSSSESRPSVGSSVPSTSSRVTRSRTRQRESDNQVESVRKLKSVDFKYGHGNNNRKRNKIIVFEENRELGRVYNFSSSGIWYCDGCFLINGQELCGRFKKSVFCPPSLHLCEPITVEEFNKDQEKIKTKYLHNFTSPQTNPVDELNVEIQSKENPTKTHEAIVSSTNGCLNVDPAASEEASSSMSTNGPSRIVDIINFEYGFNELAQIRKRFTVYEVNRFFVRQYNVTENGKWYCINCNTCYVKKDDDIVEVFGSHTCEPIVASEYRKADKLLFDKYNASKNAGKSATATTNISKQRKIPAPSIESNTKKLKESAETRLTSSNNVAPLRKLNFHEWEFKSNDRSVIIVYENDTKQLAREYVYDKELNEVVCVGCLNANPSKTCKGKRNDDDFSIMVPPSEDHICNPLPISNIRKEKEISKINEGRKRGRTDGKKDEPSSIKKAKIITPLECENRERGNDGKSAKGRDCADIPVHRAKSSSTIPPVQNTLAAVVNSNIVEKNHESAPSNLVKFSHLGGSELDQYCAKLKIPYSCNAISLWTRMDITYIAPDSVPKECFSVSEEADSAFRCFSVILTGSEASFLELKSTLLPYLCANIQSIGNKHGIDLTRTDTPLFRDLVLGSVASKVHFEAMSSFLDCRIGIFENNQWEKYGDWGKSNAEDVRICTFLFQKIGSNYSIILSFI